MRDNRLDTLKGFLIILVVLGHLIRECGYQEGLNQSISLYIYSFHMPLFILVSGFLTRRKSDIKIFWGGVLNIIVPLLVFQFISVLPGVLTNPSLLHSISFYLTPYWTLWYLLSLIIWRFFIQFVSKQILGKPILLIVISIIVSLLSGLIHNGEVLSIQRTLNFFPFFLFGYYLREGCFNALLFNRTVSLLIIGAGLSLTIVGIIPKSFDNFFVSTKQYGLSDIPIKIGILVYSFITSLSFFSIIKTNSYIAEIGSDSLFYYLYHGLIVRFIFKRLIALFNLPSSFVFILMYCLIVMAVMYLLSKVKPLQRIVKPGIQIH